MTKLIIFGTGVYFTEVSNCFDENVEIVAILDNDKNKQGDKLDGIEVLSPDRVRHLDYDYICLMSMYHLEMRAQLLSYGVSSDKIVLYYDVGKFMMSSNYKVESVNFYKKTYDIVFLSWGLDYSGSNIALFEMVKIFKRNGYTVGVISFKTGGLYQDYQKNNINVIVEPYISSENAKLLNFLSSVNFVVVNTACFAYMVDRLCEYRNGFVLWWIHESEQLGCYKFNKGIMIKKHSNLLIRSVSLLATEAFIKAHGMENVIKNLPLALPDRKVESLNKKESEKLVFAIIGVLSWIKGQDIFIKAFQKLEEVEKKQVEVWFIGADEGTFGEKIKQEIQNISQIKYLGTKPHEELLQMYKDIDVVVSTSRAETLSIVTAEGMMNKKGLLVSSSIGIAEYIKDKDNGLIFETENIDALLEKIRWILVNRSKLREMGARARETYESYFTINVFEERCMDIAKKIIK